MSHETHMPFKKRLTSREREVLDLLLQGASNKIMAHKLGVTEATIKAHLTHIYRKLEVDSRLQAVIVAGDLSPSPVSSTTSRPTMVE